MIVDRDDLTEALARLELEGGDCLEIEAKTFSEYSHAALGPTTPPSARPCPLSRIFPGAAPSCSA